MQVTPNLSTYLPRFPFHRQAIATVNETIKELCASVGPDVAQNYAQVAADKLVELAIQNHKAMHAREKAGEREDMTVMVIPLNVNRVIGLPDISANLVDGESSSRMSSWKWMTEKVFGNRSEAVFKTADYRTKLRWLNERGGSTNEQSDSKETQGQ